MEIYEALKKDHEEVKKLLNQLLVVPEDADETRSALVSQIRDALIPHARAEEAVFYNAIRSAHTKEDQVVHAYKEHFEAESLLRMLQLQDKTGMKWKETAQDLKDALEHHISEEENVIFPIAKSLFDSSEAERMTVEFNSLKPKIKEEGLFGTTWDLITNVMPQSSTSKQNRT